MFNRPRCRDWTPLATQQLRLRNLIQITGHNIINNNNKQSNIYFTLHLTLMSSPFFTSDKLDKTTNPIWPEILCQSIIKSTSKSVFIRIWEHLYDDDNNYNNDKMLFVWGVYFSGLIQITKRSDVKLRANSLILQMHGGFFTSPDCLLNEDLNKIVPKLIIINQLEQYVHQEQQQLTNNDISDEKQQQLQNNNNNNNKKLILENLCDINILKKRYLIKKFHISEIRPSYKINKLLLLQEKQRYIKLKLDLSNDLMNKICMKSAYCLNLDLIINNKKLIAPNGSSGSTVNASYYYYYDNNSDNNINMGRTLNRLLYEKKLKPKPEIIIKGQELKRKIETAKFRCKLLKNELINYKNKIKIYDENLLKLKTLNNDHELILMDNYRLLNKDKELYFIKMNLLNNHITNYNNVKLLLQQRRLQLLKELNQIFEIKLYDHQPCTINNIPLPDAESYTDNVSSTAINVALSYAAHTVLMSSIILNIPLRNPIVYDGSRSKIIDNIKILQDVDRQFPLYCRSTPPPDTLLYAVYLLNQNIAQLKYVLSLTKGDLRSTLSNLYQLLNIDAKYTTNLTINNDNSNYVLGSSTPDINHISNLPKIIIKKKLITNNSKNKKCLNNINNHNSNNDNKIIIINDTNNSQNNVDMVIGNANVKINKGILDTKRRVSRSVGSYCTSEDDEETTDGNNKQNKIQFHSEPSLINEKSN